MRPSRSPSFRHEEGSAYIVALLVLLVLTVLGLSLALVTQSELQIGANERTIHRNFYGADSGIAVVAGRLSGNDAKSMSKFEIRDPDPNPYNLRTRVDAGLPIIVDQGHANLTEINEEGAASSKQNKRLSFGVVSEATRFAGIGGEATKVPLGRRTISLIMDQSPKEGVVHLAAGSRNEDQVKRLKF